MFKIIVLSCMLAAVAVTLKIRLETPQGPEPLARAIVTTHLQQLRGEMALTEARRVAAGSALAGPKAEIRSAAIRQYPSRRRVSRHSSSCTFDTQEFRQAKASFPQLGRLKKDGNPTSAAGELQGDRNAKIVRWCCLLLRPLV